MAEERSLIVFFDVETTIPRRSGQGFDILEFGAILVCPRKLVELQSYSTLVRPADLSQVSDRSNGITRDAVASAPTFAGIARIVYNLLHGRVWAGHHILQFDCDRIREAFREINCAAPEPQGIIDSLALLRRQFGTRAGDMKMETLATYFGLGKQTHRSLDDVRMNLQVLNCCATVLFLESSLPDIFSDNNSYPASVAQMEMERGGTPAAVAGMNEPADAAMEEEKADSNSWNDFLEPHAVSIPSISATLGPSHSYWGTTIYILHQNLPLHLQCAGLKVRFGISTKYRPRLSFAVEASPDLKHILDEADGAAQKLSTDSGSSSKWHHIVTHNLGYSPHIRLNLQTEGDGEMTTEIYQRENSGTQKLMSSGFETAYQLFTPGIIVDAYFKLVAYDYKQKAGILLVAEKLVVHSS